MLYKMNQSEATFDNDTHDLENFVNLKQHELVLYLENHKIIKLTNPAYIFNSHIRNSLHNIYINSVTIESVNHTKDYVFIPQAKGNINILNQLFNDIHNAIKNDMYLTSSAYCPSYKDLTNTTFTKTTKLNKNIFVCTHGAGAFAHTMLYMYPLIYFYYILKKYMLDLVLIINYQTIYTSFLLRTLNIDDYIVINNNEQIINEGTTYFANSLTCNMTEHIMNKYFYDIIVKQTLMSYQINVSSFPKKLLFLRNKTNIVALNSLLTNSCEIEHTANKYGYINIDQTILSMEEVICLINNATHIILEAGSAMCHLLWSKNIKSIILNYRPQYYTTLASLYKDANEHLKLISDTSLCDIAKHKKSNVIYNDYNYIKTGALRNDWANFTNIVELHKLIEDNE